MNIYVAGKWKSLTQKSVVGILRSLNHNVYDYMNKIENPHGFAWTDFGIVENCAPQKFISLLVDNETVTKAFLNDFEKLRDADALVMTLPSGKSAHIEAGYLKGLGKKVFIYMTENDAPELMYKMFDGIITSEDQLKDIFSQSELPELF